MELVKRNGFVSTRYIHAQHILKLFNLNFKALQLLQSIKNILKLNLESATLLSSSSDLFFKSTHSNNPFRVTSLKTTRSNNPLSSQAMPWLKFRRKQSVDPDSGDEAEVCQVQGQIKSVIV